jgi:hypothetical protein
MSLDDEKCSVGIKLEEVTDTEEELNPQPKTFQTIKTEPEVSFILFVTDFLQLCDGDRLTASHVTVLWQSGTLHGIVH